MLTIKTMTPRETGMGAPEKMTPEQEFNQWLKGLEDKSSSQLESEMDYMQDAQGTVRPGLEEKWNTIREEIEKRKNKGA